MAAAANAQYAEAAIIGVKFGVASKLSAPALAKNVDWQGPGLQASVVVNLYGANATTALGNFYAINDAQKGFFLKNTLATKTGDFSFRKRTGPADNYVMPANFNGGVQAASSEANSATRFVGFRNSSATVVGWIKFKWNSIGNPGTPINLLEGAFSNDNTNDKIMFGSYVAGGTTGGTTTGGGGAVPEPSSLAAFAGLGALALGAAGIRKRRAEVL
jgi:hypothetical protein